MSLGPKFTPTPRKNKEELENDVKEFCRKLRLLEYFDGVEYTTDDSILRPKSNFTPPRNRDTTLDNYIDFLAKQPLEGNDNTKYNLTAEEQNALRQLKEDNDIIIKEADKGGAFVIMDTKYYQEQMDKMLGNTDTYKQLSHYKENDVKKKLEKFVKKYSKCLTSSEQKYISSFDMKTSNIYGLPKIHKSKMINDAITAQKSEYIHVKNVEDLKFRPIIAGPICPTSHLSAFLDEILKPMLPHVQSYVRDDQDFLLKLDRNITEDTVLATFDVESLYTNIDHQIGKEAISFWIDKYKEKIPQRMNRNLIIEALDIVLKNNTFIFNNTLFLQLIGTAMGTKMAPTYANLVLGYLELKLYSECERLHGLEFRQFIEKGWKRYLDDGYITWNNTFGNIQLLEDLLNNLHKSIRFTSENNKDRIPFLDILIIANSQQMKLITDIFHKKTDTFNYLPFNSCHPRHIKKNIPYTLARRIRFLAEDESTRDLRFKELKTRLLSKGYPEWIIDCGIDKAKHLKPDELYSTKQKKENGIIAVSTHNPNNNSLDKLIKGTINILNTSGKMNDVMTNKRITFAKRQPKNLKGLLSRAAFTNQQDTTQARVTKCGKNCETCKLLIEGSSIHMTTTDEDFTVRYNMNCESKNLIYIITCDGCNEQYIGETGNELKTRMTTHRQHIRDPKTRKLAVSAHIANCGRGKFKIFPFYKLHNDSTHERRTKEHLFIMKYKPSLNAITLR